MNDTLTNNESSFDKQSENSNPDKGENYMVFTSMVNSESFEEIENSDASNEESDNKSGIYEAFDELT